MPRSRRTSPSRVEDVLDHARGEPERDLVEEEEPGRGHQRPSDRDHLLLAAREPPGLLLDALLEAREEIEDLRHRIVHAGLDARRCADPEVLLDRQLLEDVAPLRHLGDAGADDPVRAHPFQARPRRVGSRRRGSKPWWMSSRPEIALIVVVLPAPFGPSSATAPCSGTTNETPRSASETP